MFRSVQNLVDPFQSYEERPPSPDVWSFLIEHLRPLRRVIALSLLFTVISASLEVWLIGYAGHLVDMLAATPRDRLWADHGLELMMVAVVVLIARPIAPLFKEGLDDIAFRPSGVTLIRWRAHRHVLRQSVGWFQNDQSGRIANRVRDVGSAATGAAYALLHTLAHVLIYVIGSIWLMASVDPRLVVPLVGWVAIYLLLMRLLVPPFRDRSEQFQESLSALSGMLVDTYANIATVKLFGHGDRDEVEGKAFFHAAWDRFARLQRVEVAINVGMVFLGSLLIFGLVGYAVVLWQSNAAPLGLIAAALALSFRITAMAEWLLDGVSALFGHVGSVRESLKTVAQPIAIADIPDAKPLQIKGGSIRLHRIRHHHGKGKGGLDDLSLLIRPKEKIGLVGPSGVGKSTLVHLILRFFDAEEGLIEVDGQDIRHVTQDSLQWQIGMVTQDPAMLHRSVRDNIAFGRRDVSKAEIEAAARLAKADGFIQGLKDQAGRMGYDAWIGERGVKLSGGQRQRIALARVILKNAPILLLDEATSALDTETEAALQASLQTVMHGKTVIAIAHRLSTLACMDRIVVIDKGRIAEDGSHAELLKRNGIYSRLWTHQVQGFIGNQLDESGDDRADGDSGAMALIAKMT